ncbi:MAG: undecaprenyl-phosphate glucose phosphotransferase [Planctomycetota bacterium]|nr:undecaprenyl-phosphate glucose phosphotransferase [Planctomycetota bacterium]
MLKRHHQLMLSILVILDAAATALCWLIAYFLRAHLGLLAVTPGNLDPRLYTSLLAVAVIVGLVSYKACGLYRPMRLGTMGRELWEIAKATILSLSILAALLFFLGVRDVSRGVVVLFAAIHPGLFFASRVSIRLALRRMRRRGLNRRYALIVGAGRAGQRMAEAIARNPWTGIEVLGFLDDRPERHGKIYLDRPVLGPVALLKDLLAEKTVDQVYLSLPPDEKDGISTAIDALGQAPVDVKLIPEGLDLLSLRREISSLDGIPVINLRESPLSGWNLALKRTVDISLSCAVMVFTAPVMLGISVAILMTSGRPIFFSQTRMGLDGRSFRILKFRTMRVGAESESWTRPDDPRRTALGRWLRRFSLDELPQFLNVILGEMSIVGPRPERPLLIEEFRRTFPRYMLRHRVRAGITGWAQVSGWRGNTSVRKRIQYDLYYIENWSMGFDLRILGLTLLRGFVQRNAY